MGWYAGEHETTRLCLQWLFANRQKLQGAHVMDYGTGSGVLAVAALLMGAASVVGLHARLRTVHAGYAFMQFQARSSHRMPVFGRWPPCLCLDYP